MTEFENWDISKRRPVQENDNGYVVVFPHYESHPDRMPGTAKGNTWHREERKGYTSQNNWNREQEIDFQAHVGKPIFPDFNDDLHVKELEPLTDFPIIRGWDPAWRHAVCIWMQIRTDKKTKRGQLRILREQTSLKADMGVLADNVLTMQDLKYDDWRGQIWDHIDVAGAQHSQTSQLTAVQILGNKGITARHKKLGPEERILMFNYLLNNKMPNGEPCFLLDRRYCPRTYTALRGLYRRKEKSNLIDPNEATHYIDGAGYGAYPNIYFPRKREPEPKVDTRVNALDEIRGPIEKVKSWLAV